MCERCGCQKGYAGRDIGTQWNKGEMRRKNTSVGSNRECFGTEMAKVNEESENDEQMN